LNGRDLIGWKTVVEELLMRASDEQYLVAEQKRRASRAYYNF